VIAAKMPLNLPDGWVYDKVYGRSTAGTLRAAAQYQRNLAFDPYGPPQPVANQAGGPAEAEAILAPPPQADATPNPGGPVATSDTAKGVAQPKETSSTVSAAQSSTHNDRTRQIGMFVLLLIILSAVTLLMWRHYRRDYAFPRRIGRRI
jgi:Ca-activated chloride channel family protein